MENKNSLYSKVFTWLGIGLLITFITGFLANELFDLKVVVSLSVISIIAELVLAFVMGLCLRKLSPTAVTIIYIVYCLLSGLNFSIIFICYKVESITFVFLITAVIFLLFAYIGKVAKVDFKKMGLYLLFTLIAIIIMSIVNIFLQSTGLEFVLTTVSIILFMLYILFDMKIIDGLDETYGEDKAAVYGAFQLYIDFINLFIEILRLVGKSRD